MRTRNKPSKLNRPEVIHLIRRFTVARLTKADERTYSLQKLADKIWARFQIKAHKSTVHRFIKELGLHFAWGKAK
jgi:transposase